MGVYRLRLTKFIELLGKENIVLLFFSAFVGIGWFATETCFVYILQLFFAAIGLINSLQIQFLSQLPKSLGFACFVLFAFALIRFLVTVARNFLATWVQQGFICHIRKQLFQSALQGDIGLSSHDVIGLFSEVTNNGGLLVYNLSLLIVDVFAAIFFIAAGAWIAPFEFFVGMAILLLTAIPLKYGSRRIAQAGQRVQGEWEKVNYELSTAIRNKFLINLYGTVNGEVSRGHKTLHKYFEHQKKFGFWLGILSASPVFIGVCSVIVVSYASVQYGQIKPMNLVAFLYIFMRLAQVGGEANTVFSFVRFNIPSLQALYDWLYRQQPIKTKKETFGSKITRVESVRFDDVGFSFGHRHLFSDLNFEVRTGETLAVVGQSGSGKTTLLSNLLGLIPVTRGQVLINGISVSTVQPSWRERVAYVGPDPFTIEGSLKENLLYGNKRNDIRDEEIWNAIEMVGLTKDIRAISEGINFYLKSASRFSSGQLQRISIARALLRDFDVMIFDEGTANLDGATAQAVLEKVRTLSKNKIFIRVTHQGVSPGLEKVIDLQSIKGDASLASMTSC